MTDFNSLKKQFDALSSICSVSADGEDALRVFRSRMSIMIMRVWSAQPGFHEDYIPALALMTEGEEISEEDICDFMAQAAAKPVIPMLPAFVQLTVAAGDRDPSICRSFVDGLVSFLTDMAFVNGDCTPEEANEIEAIRMVHMDFYNEYMLTKRRVKSGAVPAGKFTYNRYGATVEYRLKADGTADLEDVQHRSQKAGKPSFRFRSRFRIPEEIVELDRASMERAGITELKLYVTSAEGDLNIQGQIYAGDNLAESFYLEGILYDRDGDIIEQKESSCYGDGLVSSYIDRDCFFQGYPFEIDFYVSEKKLKDVLKVRITVNC